MARIFSHKLHFSLVDNTSRLLPRNEAAHEHRGFFAILKKTTNDWGIVIKSTSLSSRRARVLLQASVVSVALSVLVSSPFLSNRLDADEEWMLFGEFASLRYDFWGTLGGLIAYSFGEVSVFSRVRFAYPFTEAIGGGATNAIEDVLGLDPMMAYAIFRVLVVCLVAAVFVSMVWVLSSEFNLAIRSVATFMAAFAVPSLAIAADRYSAFRVFPSHYGLMAVLGMIFVIVLWLLFRRFERTSSVLQKFLILVLTAIAGVSMVIGSEFFYAIGLAVIAARLIHFMFAGSYDTGSFRRGLIPLGVFSLSFLTALLSVRIFLADTCSMTPSCYTRSKLSFDLGSLFDGFYVFTGRLPFVIHVASVSRGGGEGVGIEFFALVLLVVLVAIFWFMKTLSSEFSESMPRSTDALRAGLFLTGAGVAWSLASAVAVASTEAWAKGPLGSGSFEIIQLAIGSGFILVGFGLFFHSVYLRIVDGVPNQRTIFDSGNLVISSVLITALLTTVWSTNMGSTRSQGEVGDILAQRELSVRVVTPDVVGNEVTDRCDILVNKLRLFPRWRGHEDTVIGGLNLRYQKTYSVDFCPLATIESVLAERDVE